MNISSLLPLLLFTLDTSKPEMPTYLKKYNTYTEYYKYGSDE